MNETIDKTQWVPRGETLVSPERISKGDIVYENGRYRKEHEQIVDALLDKGFLTDGEHQAAMIYKRIRECQYTRLGYSKMMDIVLEITGELYSNTDLYRVYSEACLYLTRKEKCLVNGICDNDEYIWVSNDHKQIKRAFEKLQESVDKTMNECNTENTERGELRPEFR